MSAAALVYNRLPASRPLLAAAKGLYLRWWRYGADTEAQVEAVLDRERWSATRWEAWREERLAGLLRGAAADVAYYRNLPVANRERLENWPLLDKDRLRADPAAFLRAGRNPRWMLHKQTSGTTGKPLHLWTSRRASREWYAIFEARCRRWSGVSRRDPYAMLGGQIVTPARQNAPPFWVWNSALRQLYLSGIHISPKNARHYAEAMLRYRVRYVLGFPSLLNALAVGMREAGARPVPLRVVLANGEPLLEHQRRAIAEVFQCPVRETYGMCEAVAGAGECEHGRLHLWPDAGLLEVLENGAPVPPGVEGEFVCTGLINTDMPLIRYRIGDRGALDGAACPCGRTLPVISRISGRASDLLVGRDGRVVYWLNPVFYGLPVAEAQIVQERPDAVQVRYVEAPRFSRRDRETLRTRLRDRLGDVEVEFERMDRIPRGANGKFQPVVCRIPQAARS